MADAEKKVPAIKVPAIIYMEPDLRRRLEGQAVERGMVLSQYVRWLLWRQVNNPPDIHGTGQ